MGLSHLTPDEVAAFVAASCAAQGVAVKVSDPSVVRRVGALLGAPGPGRARTRGAGARGTGTGATSVPPHDLDPGRVQRHDPRGAGSDDNVVDQGLDDGVLTVQVQRPPRLRERGAIAG